MIERLAIDTEGYQLLEESGLRAASVRMTYASEAFQDMVRAAFGDLMPRIRSDGEGRFWYENFDEESRETASLSCHADGKWPWYEVERLRTGWERLKAMAAGSRDAGLQSMAQAFQLPDPENEARCYRLYTDTCGVERMHVLWGFVPKAARAHSVAADVVVGAMSGHAVKPVRVVGEAIPAGIEKHHRVEFPAKGRRQASPMAAWAGIASLAALYFLIAVVTSSGVLGENRKRTVDGPTPTRVHLTPANSALISG